MTEHVLYVITCATPAARDVGKLVDLAQGRGWTVCLIATPRALRFIDQAALEQQTGYPVRSDYKEPGTPDILPPATAMIVGGASFNTINKWAAGIADTLALGLITEGIGLGIPLVALPFLNAAQAAHPAFGRSVKELRDAGVRVLLGSEGYEPHVPHHGSKNLPNYPWALALDAVEVVTP
nr:flavoprotein [Kibdelosporangium sp. MJ126-NF4]CEL18551.1 Phosphopantothenoylcysteine decarboxylase homolog [Kibdelosporangium sp. MJ126-NF4]CTQ98035.1 Phosphopantothenoylcysteine decarboxylase (EC 4.1.1.36) homolog [Kibdelosporangium sp. MJ126-NF4]